MYLRPRRTYPDEVLELLVVLQLLLVEAHRLQVVAAEVPVALLHLLPDLARELGNKHGGDKDASWFTFCIIII